MQMVSARVSDVSLNNIESMAGDYQGLSQLTVVHSDTSSISQLKRISRDIFDHLAEHLGTHCEYAYVSLVSGCLTSWISGKSTGIFFPHGNAGNLPEICHVLDIACSLLV